MAFYDNLKLEKGMYNNNFTKTLEALDPSENYEGTNLEGLDAYERQLRRFNIKVNGENSDNLEAFFATTDSSVLFPEFVKRSVEQGLMEESLLPSIVSTITKIDGNDYRTITSTTDEDSDDVVSEANELPETVIKNQSSLVTMKKRGRIISSSYEALRLKRLDLFSVVLKQIGAEIARAQLSDAVDVLAGVGSSITSVTPASVSGFAYGDLLELWAALAPYQMNTILAKTSMMQTILSLSEMRDSDAGLNFQGTGKMITPLGATLVRADSVADNTIIGIDKNCALEMIQAGDIVVDYDKLINKQLDRTVISSTVGFAKIFENASKKLTYVSGD